MRSVELHSLDDDDQLSHEWCSGCDLDICGLVTELPGGRAQWWVKPVTGEQPAVMGQAQTFDEAKREVERLRGMLMQNNPRGDRE